MAKVKWEKKLSVGVEVIDDQHKTLIQRLNDVAEAVAVRQGEREIIKSLSFLADYTQTHFATEEKLMKQHEYPDAAAHLALHEEFRTTLKDMQEELDEEGATPQLADAVKSLLINWLINHIHVVDKKLGAFLKEKHV